MMAVYYRHNYMDERRGALTQLVDKILKLASADDAALEKMDRDGVPSSSMAVPLPS